MFGSDVREAVTSSILRTSGYPAALTALMCAFVAAIPFTKVPLAARPIVDTVELALGVRHHHHHHHSGESQAYRTAVRALARVAVLGVFLFMAVLFPEFDSIMAFMGSALCFSICVM